MEEEWGRQTRLRATSGTDSDTRALIMPRGTSKRKREVDLPSGEPGCKQDAAAREDNARTRRGLARSLPSEIPGYSPAILTWPLLRVAGRSCSLESSLKY